MNTTEANNTETHIHQRKWQRLEEIPCCFTNTYVTKLEHKSREAVQGRKVVLILDSEDTPHCFSKLRLLTDYNRIDDNRGRFKRFLHFDGSKCLLSSELYKEHNLNMIRQDAPKFDTIHGPCISDPNERSSLSRDIFTLFLSHASSREPQLSRIQRKHNVLQYFTYRRIISQLLISVHSDAASGWLMLASFFYNHKKYMESILLIDYIISKCTDEKIESPKGVWLGFNRNQQLMLNSIKHENLITILKALTIQELRFCDNSQMIPIELLPVLMPDINLCIHPKPFAQFLRFLCYYHLHDLTPCRHIVFQLNQIVKDNKLFQYYVVGNKLRLKYSQDSKHFTLFDMFYIVRFLRIAHQMTGEPVCDLARLYSRTFDHMTSFVDID
ncbi:unnamed protein product [Mytilus coruscus]|uniref:Uncharacterized protein n=1 Tax=Mytilus coruscus TaxID=42192 RepID=A0A6J8E5F0_MYTCO|nr:unnamed protein product [Mytilus coruscus]